MGCAASLPAVQSTILLKTIQDKPYEGTQLCYSFNVEEVPITLSSRTEGHVRQQLDDESLQKLQTKLEESYKKGQTLLALCDIRQPITSANSDLKPKTAQFQAIFRKNTTETEGNEEKFSVTVEKVDILGRIVGDGGFSDSDFEIQTNTKHILELLQDKAATGARFKSAATTGSSMYQGFNFSLDGSKPVVQMNFIFETLCIHNLDLFSYQVEPVQVIQKVSESIAGKKIVMECDWVSVFTQKLKTGWRLVDIFPDGSTKSRLSKSGPEVIKTYLWIFEKPFAEEIEVVQRFEGAVIELTASGSPEKAISAIDGAAYWEGEINRMGEEGWELTCIIQNPSVQRNLCQVKFGCVLFFQRRM